MVETKYKTDSSEFSGCENLKDFRIDSIFVSPSAHSLSADNKTVRLEAKVMNVLCVLSIEPGQVVTRKQFLELLWENRSGADECLTRAISSLRHAITQLDQDKAIIETIPKSGYRLNLN